MSSSLRPHGLQHTRVPCPSLTPRVCSNSCPWSWWSIQPFIYFLIEGLLQYRIGFCHTSTWISHRCTYVPFLFSFPPTSQPVSHHLGCHRSRVWAPWVKQPIPTGYRFYIWWCIYFYATLSTPLLPTPPPRVRTSVLSVCISTGVGGFLEEAGFTLNSKIHAFHRKEGHPNRSNCLSPCNYYTYLIFLGYLLLRVGNALGDGDLVRSLLSQSFSLRQTQFLSDVFMPSSRNKVQGDEMDAIFCFAYYHVSLCDYNHWYIWNGKRITVWHIKCIKQWNW